MRVGSSFKDIAEDVEKGLFRQKNTRVHTVMELMQASNYHQHQGLESNENRHRKHEKKEDGTLYDID